MVLAPEHELVPKLTAPELRGGIDAYRDAASRKSELERTELQKDKTGVFTGAYAVNPATGGTIPIWIADYVLAGYGTGAIMAVPGGDQRDFEFAQKFGLPVIRTVQPPADFDGASAWVGDGTVINSGFLNGKNVEQAKAAMIEWLEREGKGERRVNYKLRDWLFSRQRYWGEPLPIVFVDGKPQTVADSELPVRLPELDDFKPSGSPEGPLAKAGAWLETVDPKTGRKARARDQHDAAVGGLVLVLPALHRSEQWRAAHRSASSRITGCPSICTSAAPSMRCCTCSTPASGTRRCYDAGVVSTPEPFLKLVHQGMILGELEFTVNGERVAEDRVEKQGDRFVLRDDPKVTVEARAYKMSKSRGNVVNPDEIVARYGADAFRLYEMFMGPLEQVKPWNTRGVEGTHRFLNRVWRLVAGSEADGRRQRAGAGRRAEPTREQQRVVHQTIAKVTEDIDAMRFNTAISALMELTNAAYKWPQMPRAAAETLVLLLAPLAPHLAEELWQRLGANESLAYHAWPVADSSAAQSRRARDPRAGQRQGARQDLGARRSARKRSHRDRQGGPERQQASRRSEREARDLRPRPHRELRRRRLTALPWPKRVVVIACWGSHGDLFPYIGLALALKKRGHRPVVATNSGYRDKIEHEGIEFAAAGPTIDPNAPNARELFERVMDPKKGSEVIVRELLMPELRANVRRAAPRGRRRRPARDAPDHVRRHPSSPSKRACRGCRPCSRRCRSSRPTILPCCRRRRA